MPQRPKRRHAQFWRDLLKLMLVKLQILIWHHFHLDIHLQDC